MSNTPDAGSTGGTAAHDPEVAEEFAATAGTDPTPDQIDEYRALSGEAPLGAETDALPDPALDEVEDPDFQDPEVRDPEHASSERAAETPPHDDAERMEAALRIGGPLVTDDEEEAQQRREQPTEDGPGTSLN